MIFKGLGIVSHHKIGISNIVLCDQKLENIPCAACLSLLFLDRKCPKLNLKRFLEPLLPKIYHCHSIHSINIAITLLTLVEYALIRQLFIKFKSFIEIFGLIIRLSHERKGIFVLI